MDALAQPLTHDVVVLDLPPPLSVNRTRRVDWTAQPKLRAWKEQADRFVMAAKRSPNPPKFDRLERFTVTIILSEDHCELDADNGIKSVIDYLRRIEVIANDAKKNMRGLHVIWGHAPAGCRVVVRNCGDGMPSYADPPFACPPDSIA